MDFIGKVCPYCKTEFKEGDDVVVCSVCEMPHHKECWIENKACTTFGCTGTIVGAEQYIDDTKSSKDSNFTKAKEIYASLPQDFVYNGISASARLNLLNNSQSLLDAMGTYKATANYIESRNIYRRNGSWDNWYIDQVESGQTLKLSCKLNSSNTFDIEGTVTFYKFNNYSSLSSACQAKQTSRSIEIKNVTSIPSTYQLDSYTTLTYSGGVFKLKYSQRDDYSAYFYNMYNSSVTSGK